MTPTGQYYTTDVFSTLLVSGLQQEAPASILEIGAGHGALLAAAASRWEKAAVYAAELDHRNVLSAMLRLPSVQIRHLDGLNPRLPELLELQSGTVDVAVCNPPYCRQHQGLAVSELLVEAGLQDSVAPHQVTLEVLFLAQNLRMLRGGGELGIILPDGIVAAEGYTALRESLLCNHALRGVIQLPDSAFKNTEARTHILLVEKGGVTPRVVPVCKANSQGEVESTILVPRSRVGLRMDFSYHLWKDSAESTPLSPSLLDIGVEVKRGRRSTAELRRLGVSFFHTSDFPRSFTSEVDLPSSVSVDDTYACAGDILVARVGKRCVGKVALVRTGNIPVSDCVYRLRVPERYHNAVRETLASQKWRQWVAANTRGVCARFINKKDLLHLQLT